MLNACMDLDLPVHSFIWGYHFVFVQIKRDVIAIGLLVFFISSPNNSSTIPFSGTVDSFRIACLAGKRFLRYSCWNGIVMDFIIWELFTSHCS